MKDTAKTKKQLIAELEELRQQQSVEQALDRVRTQVAAMQQSEDLFKVVDVVRETLIGLDVPCEDIAINTIDEEAGTKQTHHNQFSNTTSSPLDEEFYEPWKKGEPFIRFITIESQQARTQKIFDKGLLEDTRENREFIGTGVQYLAKRGGKAWFVDVPFAHGTLSMNKYDSTPFTDYHIHLLKRFTAVFALGYRRFLDFQELETANREIQQATQRKSAFLARMSHDLRTPMNAIIGYTRILLRRSKEVLEPRQYRNLENIETSSQNLLSLINDILDLSKIESGRIDIRPEQIDLEQLIGECTASIESLLKPNVELRQQIDGVTAVYTDADRLRRVLMNLLSNAVKFTEAGNITIALKAADDTVELSVADTGPGIPAADQPHIFEEFRQVDGDDAKMQEGSGLGLAIAKKSMELLGGTIELESKVGRGTTFTIQIKNHDA